MELSTASILGSLEDGRYHSCLLTTYSFDPGFMHQRVVPQLRTCGIRNVLALVDGDMLAEAIAQRIDSGQFTHPRYGLWPIHQAHGVFHPKVMLCLGAAHGFLAIGSGNLTQGGHGGNDELWSILRHTPEDERYRPFFSELLAAIRTWAGEAGDWSARQFEWAQEHTPWLSAATAPATIATGDGTVTRLVLAPGNGVVRVFKEAIGDRRVERITVLSPFLDERGALLSELVNLTSGPVHVVVDELNGAVPPQLPNALVERLKFQRWQDVQSLHEEGHACALHAKAIVLELADGVELCYQGSANASVAAMGNSAIDPVNVEAGVLLERAEGGFLRRLGLRLKVRAIPYNELRHSVTTEPQPAAARDVLRLLSISFTEQQFVVATATAIPDGTRLKLRDPERLQEIDLPLVQMEDCWRATGEFERVPTLGALYAPDGTRLSNWQAVQLHELHVRNDPDARARHIESLVDRLELGDDHLLAEIVPYLPLPDMEVAAMPSDGASRAGSGDPLLGERQVSAPVTGATPYIDWEESAQGSRRAHDTSTVHRVVDVLMRSLHASAPELEEISEQEADSGMDEGAGPAVFEARRPQGRTTQVAHKARKRQLLKYISDYQRSMERRLGQLAGTQNLGKVAQVNVVDDDFAHAIILCRMLMHFLLRPTRDGSNAQSASAGVYLQLQGDRIDDNVLEVVPLAIGSFQLLAQQAVERERSEWTQKRFDRYREHLLADQLYCICNVEWPENTMHWFDLLVLNTMVLLDRSRPLREQMIAAFDHLSALRTDDRFQCRSFDTNVDEAWRLLSADLSLWLALHEKQIEPTRSRDIEPGSHIYHPKLGICLVDAVEPYSADAAMLTLCRPGLEWNEELEDYALRHVFRSNRVLPVR
jgi:hypothetical protein